MSSRTRGVVLGLDAGATKTDVLLCERSGRVLGFARSGSGNWEAVGIEAASQALGDATRRALGAAGVFAADVEAAAFAVAGYDWPSDGPRLEPVLDSLGLAGRRRLYNDAYAALRAGTAAPNAIISAAGTGTVTAGRNAKGQTFRTLGIGRGERGGALDLVERALDALADGHHRGDPPGALAELLCHEERVRSLPELFERLSRDQPGRRRLTRLAPSVTRAARAGDSRALRVLARLGRGLARTVLVVARRLAVHQEAFDVVCAGGVHTAGGELARSFGQVVSRACPGATIRLLSVPPVAGAALLALDELGPVSDATEARLLSEVVPAVSSVAPFPG